MRIDRLTISAIGPYPGTHTINFSLLGESGLFLIDGPVGSGKTTILDSIVFALYDKSSGDVNPDDKLRSNHVSYPTTSEVELEFTVSSGTYRVTRTPSYSRPKRGGGETDVDGTCSVSRVLPSGALENLAQLPVKANPIIRALVGLAPEQFRQTVVLPQGEFASFLKASSKERQPILQRIFATEFYDKVEKALKEAAGESRDRMKELDQRISEAISGLAARLGLDEAVATALKASAVSGNAGVALDEIQARLVAAKAAADEAAKPAVAAERAALEALEARKAERAAADAAVASATGVTNAREELAQTAAAVAGGHAKALRDVSQSDADVSDQKVATSVAQAVNTAVNDLQTALAAEAELAATMATRDAARDAIPGLEEEIEALAAQIDTELPDQRKLLEKRREAALAAAAKIESAAKAVADAEKTATLASDLTKAMTVQKKAKGDSETAAKHAAAARRLADDLIAARLANAAADLADQLVPGQPCAVCGSTDHPAKAVRAGDAITDEAVQDARSVADGAETAAQAAARRAAEAETTVATLTGRIEEAGGAQAVDLATATAAYKAVADEAATEPALAQQIGAISELITKAVNQRTAKSTELGALRADLTRMDKQIADAEKAVERERHEFETVAKRASALTALVAALGSLDDVRNAVTAALAVHETAVKALKELPQHPAFGDVAGASALHDEAKAALETSTHDVKAAAKDVKDGRELDKRIRDAIASRDEEVSSSRALLKLADLASGKNPRNMTLSTYVLTTLFEEVLGLTNLRLQTLLEGRYALVSRTTGGDKRTAWGLDLLVYDNHVEKARTIKSLSGGETFCVSLALALSLAELVQSENGGIAIDTLFIDEGFGSQDEGRLGDIMNMLLALRSHGRTVGLISHVESMKSQIQDRITSIPNAENGTSTLTVSWMTD